MFKPMEDRVADVAAPAVSQISLAGFVAFLETKDPNQQYPWYKITHCAVGQYLVSLGMTASRSDGPFMRAWDLPLVRGLSDLVQPAQGTFGSALRIAKAALKGR